MSALKYNPDALPFSFGRICAPSGTRACRAMLETHLIRRALSRSFNDASNSAFSCNCNPSRSAVTSLVMSSLVGPSPPVTKIISAHENNSRSVSPIAGPSPTVLRSSIRNPTEKISRAMKARCVSCTSPARSSVPVLRRTALMNRSKRSTSNAQRPTLKQKLRLIEHSTLKVERFLPKSGGGFLLLLANQREFFAFDHRAIDRHFRNIFAARHIVHDVEHDPLEPRANRAC